MASLLIPVDIAVAWTPDEVRNAVMGAYLAGSYGLLGLALIRQASHIGTHESERSFMDSHYRKGPGARGK